MLKHFQTPSTTPAPASIVDGKLILSFPKAKNPILWQMDLGNIKISALEIQTLNGEATLVLKNPKGESVTIASFSNHNDAVENLIAISSALGKAKGNIMNIANENQGTAPNPADKKNIFKTALTILGAVTLLILLTSFISSLFRISTPNINTGTSAPISTDGAPISADDFLKGQ